MDPLSEIGSETFNDLSDVSEAFSKDAEPSVLLSWLAKDGRQLQVCPHVHLSVRRRGLDPRSEIGTRDLCAVAEGGSWRIVLNPQQREWEADSDGDLWCLREPCRGSVDEPVFVGVREPLKRQKAWLSCGGRIRLKPLDHCDVISMNEIEGPPPFILRRIHDFRFPALFVFHDRELVVGMGPSATPVDYQLINEMIEAPPNVVDGLPESQPPIEDGELSLYFHEDGERIVRFVDLSSHCVGVTLNPLPHLVAERVQLIFGAVELGTASGERVAHTPTSP